MKDDYWLHYSLSYSRSGLFSISIFGDRKTDLFVKSELRNVIYGKTQSNSVLIENPNKTEAHSHAKIF